MDAGTIALIVAAIAAGSGLVQAAVQGTLAARNASVGARQEAARAAIAMYDRLTENVADVSCSVEMFILDSRPELIEDIASRDALRRAILVANRRAFGAAAAVSAASVCREPIRKALTLAEEIVAITDQHLIEVIWAQNSNVFSSALGAIGRARSHHYRRLETAASLWWVRNEVERNRPDRLSQN